VVTVAAWSAPRTQVWSSRELSELGCGLVYQAGQPAQAAARWLGEAGEPALAAAQYRHLLTDAVRILGPDHPDILTTRANLADMVGEAGQPAQATDEYREVGV
jgi:hypothetical protein